MGWREEFGDAWEPPKEIAQLEGIDDMSWHNDTMPSFGKEVGPKGTLVRLWSDHPDQDERESGSGKRFSVTVDGDADEVDRIKDQGLDVDDWPVWETNDPQDAVVHFMKTLGTVSLALRSDSPGPER